MAGEWLKFEKATPEKPEVMAIAAELGCERDLVVGKLIRLWSWFDTHTESGNARGVTPALLDAYFGVTGFVTAVEKVGWLVIDTGGISLPNFDRHCGETAKQRALTAKRVAAFKAGNGKGNDKPVTGALPREEKKREEKKKEQKLDAPHLDSGYQPILSAYHETLPNCQKAAALTNTRKRSLARAVKLAKDVCASNGWTYEPQTFWRGYFAVCAEDPWLRGDVQNPKNPRWKQNLDVLLADERLGQVIDKAMSGASHEN